MYIFSQRKDLRPLAICQWSESFLNKILTNAALVIFICYMKSSYGCLLYHAIYMHELCAALVADADEIALLRLRSFSWVKKVNEA